MHQHPKTSWRTVRLQQHLMHGVTGVTTVNLPYTYSCYVYRTIHHPQHCAATLIEVQNSKNKRRMDTLSQQQACGRTCNQVACCTCTLTQKTCKSELLLSLTLEAFYVLPEHPNG
jgi:hypothetical protein